MGHVHAIGGVRPPGFGNDMAIAHQHETRLQLEPGPLDFIQERQDIFGANALRLGRAA